jgi:HAE1 family hydrophobic/amphiphilic exporter-1
MARTVMDAFYGREVADFTRQNKNIDIRVQLNKANQTSLQDLRLLDVPTRQGGKVPLVEVADINLESGLSHIQRRNQKRLINVFCDVDQNAGYDVAEIRKTMETYLKHDLPAERHITASVHGENDEQEQSMSDLKRAFVVGIVLIFCILTVQFNSFRQPLIVLLAVPLALIGAVFGLYVTGVRFGFMATVGVVALVGIVVNDNIVLVDYCNQLRRQGINRDEALIEAGLRRLRPILLTTITTLGGLLPLTLDWGGGGAFWLPLGVTIIFGLGIDSLLTLIIVPVIYSLVEKPGPLPPRGLED